MLLHSFGRDFAPWNEYARTIREETGAAIEAARRYLRGFARRPARFTEQEEGPFVDYLHALLSSGSSIWSLPSAPRRQTSCSDTGRSFFPSVPAVYTGVEQRANSFLRSHHRE